MHKTATKFLLLFFLLTASAVRFSFAQTITIGTIDPGPYGPGSTIAIPFHIDDSGGCIQQNNKFGLLMSNASGVFTSNTPVAFTDPNTFYATFINYTIPTNFATPGTNYQFKIIATSPTITSNPSSAISINTTPGIAAGISSTAINSTYSTPSNVVFGACSSPESSYFFTNASDAGAITVTAKFYNELSQSTEVSSVNVTNNGFNFGANDANYTVTVKAINSNGVVGTREYQLINNPINNTLGATGNASVCIQGGVAPLTKNIDYTSATGIEYNYPGNVYTFTWGDGSAPTILTFCQIKALNGLITHNYTKASCGNTANGQVNSFEVDFSASNVYCGAIGTTTSSYSKIVTSPTNDILSADGTSPPPSTWCTNSKLTLFNHSIAGPDPNATTSSCQENPNALYTWLVDGIIVYQNYKKSQNFTYTFTSNGNHTVTLRAQTSNGACTAADKQISICIQNPPTPTFTLPVSPYCLSSGPVKPVNTSTVDNTCVTSNYQWSVTPNTFTYTGGTSTTSQTPQFNFTAAGIYTIQLGITSASCGLIQSAPQTLVVNDQPVATLSGDLSVCGNNQTLSFNSNSGQTTTILTGTAQQLPTTYTWTVTGGASSFVGGTTANSQYPQILFNDYATYTVTVTHMNNCGTVSSSQHITFLQAPTVSAGSAQTICQGATVHLTGSISGNYVSSQWTNGSGSISGFTNATSLTTDYTPSAADIAAGTITLTLTATTGLVAPCNTISSQVTITIIPTDVVTSSPTKVICSNSPVNYAITASNAGSTFTWTATSSTATGFTANGSGSTISDVLVSNDPTTDAVVKYLITPTSGPCAGTPFLFTVTIPAVAVVNPTSTNASICSGSAAGISLASAQTGTKYTWTVAAPAGVTGATAVSTPTANTTISDVLTNTGTTNATVTYTITPYNTAGCPGTPTAISITVYPQPVVANAGPDVSICDATAFNLQGNMPAFGTGLWTVVTGSNVTFTDATKAGTTVNGLLPGNVYEFRWTISSGTGCQTSDDVVITVNMPTVGGTTATTDLTTACAGGNAGTINLSGQTGNILRWEQSTDNGATWQPTAANTTATLMYQNLVKTTQFRAVVQNVSCSIMASTPTTITVNTNTPVSNAGANQVLCGATTTTLTGNDPGTFAGLWTQTAGPVVTFADASRYNTAVTGLAGGNSYAFVWTITGLTPCPNTQSTVNIADNLDISSSFTTSPKSGCGNLSVQFTNTSNSTTGSFVWDFGDGSAQSTAISPTHVFAQRTDGRDTTYIISLSVLNNCLQRAPFIDSVRVRPATPIARILPNAINGCGNFALTVQNISPGTNMTYDFYLYDGSTLVQKITKTDKTSAVFNPLNTTVRKSFTVYMIATGFCNNTNESAHVPFTVSPNDLTAQMYVQNNINSGCAPLNVTFYNNSSSGDNFTYNIYDHNNKLVNQVIGGLDPLPYVLDSVGTFYVSITASNSCSMVESPKTRIDVFAVPTASFTADTIAGCRNVNVQFINKTLSNDPNTAVTSLKYDWNFGDGSTHSSNFTPPPHTYNYKNSPYTVTLTVTNVTSGCTNTLVKQSFITINGPPSPEFTEKPDSVTTIPNYSFSFADQSIGSPTSWFWVFGQGSTAQYSKLKNPTITFPDTGSYRVSLTVTNSVGCDSTVVHHVRINGTPGQLFLPNAFVPTSATPELRVFMAKGSGIAKWHLQIFNKYGQQVWETTRLDSQGAPIDGWDGTFKGVPAPQGVYVWMASATFINGNEWKGNAYNNSSPRLTGSVHLIR